MGLFQKNIVQFFSRLRILFVLRFFLFWIYGFKISIFALAPQGGVLLVFWAGVF